MPAVRAAMRQVRELVRLKSAGLPTREIARRSTLITSQIPVDKWHQLIGDPIYADAILDRLVHNAHRLTLAGDSLRKKRSPLTAKS